MIGRTKKVGLALGGGTIRGMAHLGVIKALLNYNIPIDIITGTSAGALVGGAYSGCKDIQRLIKITKTTHWKHMMGFSLSKKSLVSASPIIRLFEKELGFLRFSDLYIPFAAIATEISTGKPVVFNTPEMFVGTAILASISVPGVFMPVLIQDEYYFDGGASDNLPVKAAKELGADVVIAVDVLPKTERIQHPLSNLALIADRAIDLMLQFSSVTGYQAANLVLKPINRYFSSFDIKYIDELIDLGEACVETHIESIKKLVK